MALEFLKQLIAVVTPLPTVVIAEITVYLDNSATLITCSVRGDDGDIDPSPEIYIIPHSSLSHQECADLKAWEQPDNAMNGPTDIEFGLDDGSEIEINRNYLYVRLLLAIDNQWQEFFLQPDQVYVPELSVIRFLRIHRFHEDQAIVDFVSPDPFPGSKKRKRTSFYADEPQYVDYDFIG